jgi:phosphohistidine phosphatase
MRLYIMRHGEAEQHTRVDSLRELNAIGKTEAFNAGQKLSAQYTQLDSAWVSEYIRAQQTYNEVSKSIKCLEVKHSIEIIPSSRPLDVQRALDLWLLKDGIQSMLIVSHMPLVSYLVDQLCDNTGAMLFPTAAIAEVDYDPELSLGQLVGFSAPD